VQTWTRAHLPELGVLCVGILLRLSMAITYDARIGFDFNGHWPHIRYIVTHGSLPPFDFNTTTYHPPLYYVITAAMVRAGLDAGALGWLAASWGIVRLGVIWAALEKWLPESRLARVVALLTASVIPVGVQLDGMITNETLAVLLSALVFLAAPAAIVAARTAHVAPMARLARLRRLGEGQSGALCQDALSRSADTRFLRGLGSRRVRAPHLPHRVPPLGAICRAGADGRAANPPDGSAMFAR
jgi:hypothetical protein